MYGGFHESDTVGKVDEKRWDGGRDDGIVDLLIPDVCLRPFPKTSRYLK
jgi:hypothetical protein